MNGHTQDCTSFSRLWANHKIAFNREEGRTRSTREEQRGAEKEGKKDNLEGFLAFLWVNQSVFTLAAANMLV